MADVASFLCQGICHQLPDRMLSLSEGVGLPACARCSGMHIGALAMYLALLMRGQLVAAKPWPRWLIVSGVTIWLLTGLDVGIQFMWSEAPFDATRRLITGLLVGMTLPALLVTASSLLASTPTSMTRCVIDRPRDFLVPLLIGIGLLAPLLVPVKAIWIAVGWIAVVGLLAVMSHVNSIPLRLIGRALRWNWPRWAQVVVIVALTLGELTLFALGRAWLEARIRPTVEQIEVSNALDGFESGA